MNHDFEAAPLPAIDLISNAESANPDRFMREALLAGAQVYRCTHAQIRATLLKALERESDDAAVLFESRELMQFTGWEVGTQKMSGCWMRELRQGTAVTTRDFEVSTVAVGVTGVDFGLCDTGTLVLRTSERRGRLLSLLPPVHVALLERERLLPDLAAFLAQPLSNASAITFITGPSKTADIEQKLTTGVHGPGRIHILLVEN
ncbi:MAG TPA: lactate utilization protein [Acidobacteriota bacterium]|jgi:L-lactate dehydrogenase complex protein LldG